MVEKGKSSTKKRSYQQPALKVYGSVKALTAAGSKGGSEAEGDSNSGKCSDPSFKLHKFCPSDRSLKENIVCVGSHPLGIGIYLFNFKPAYRDMYGHGRQFGVMADEVERVLPEAVSLHPDGYKLVDYGMLGVSRKLQ